MSSKIAPYINQDVLKEKTRAYEGHALTVFNPELYHYRETDFLEIGCDK